MKFIISRVQYTEDKPVDDTRVKKELITHKDRRDFINFYRGNVQEEPFKNKDFKTFWFSTGWGHSQDEKGIFRFLKEEMWTITLETLEELTQLQNKVKHSLIVGSYLEDIKGNPIYYIQVYDDHLD